MGNRTYLQIGDRCQFEANNVIPLSWLAIFQSKEFLTDQIVDEDDEWEDGKTVSNLVAGYQTTIPKAKQRVSSLILKLKGRSPAWKYLKPLEILMSEIIYCSDEDVVQMELTQFYELNEYYERWVKTIVADFQKLISKLHYDETDEILVSTFINKLLDPFINKPIQSLEHLSSEEKMFIFIGFYDSADDVDKYPLTYFNDEYWREI